MTPTGFAVASLRLPPESPFIDVMAPASAFGRWSARAVTFIRIPIGLFGIACISDNLKLLAIVSFVVFALIDVLDGVAARKAGCDTAARRAGDVLLDRVAIHGAALMCCAVYSQGWIAWILLLSRDLAQAITSWRFSSRTKVVVIGAHWHMSYGLSMLAWGAAFIWQGRPNLVLTVITAAISVATFVDYNDRCQKLERKFLVP